MRVYGYVCVINMKTENSDAQSVFPSTCGVRDVEHTSQESLLKESV